MPTVRAGCGLRQHCPYVVRIQAYDGKPSDLELRLAEEVISGREDQKTVPAGEMLCPEVAANVVFDPQTPVFDLDLADYR